ncbi:MAG: PEGA domain-containing protein [Trueperaceae bacterium]|nr:PEGA domain-containing protein [Trueperaceae bacterium]
MHPFAPFRSTPRPRAAGAPCLVAFVLAAVAGLAAAQDVRLDPQAIVVNPDPAFGVEVTLDRGGALPAYEVGDPIEVTVRATRDAWVYLYSVEPDGRVQQIVPNRYEGSLRLRAGERVTVPGEGAGYRFAVDPPYGVSLVLAIASRAELDVAPLARFEGDAAFAQSDVGVGGFQRRVETLLQRVAQDAWASGSVGYRVVDADRARGEATLSVVSDPDGAEVYLDGTYQGRTPLRVVTDAGVRTVTVTREGYLTERRTVRLLQGGGERVAFDLTRAARDGRLDVASRPSGAEVYVGGVYQGRTPLRGLPFAPGTYDVRVERGGYAPATRTVTIRGGATVDLDVVLRREGGTLDVRGEVPGSVVFLDGRRVGTLAGGAASLRIDDVPAGVAELTVVAPGYATVVRRVDVPAGVARDVALRQDRLPER